MNKIFIKETIGYGTALWLIGYVLGIILFMAVPANLIGWVISPIGILITLWVLVYKIKSTNPSYYLKISFIWTIIAIVLDYFLLVKLFKPAGGYYKLDVYFYYTSTFVLPLLVGILKAGKEKSMPSFLEKQAQEKAERKQKILEFASGKEKITNDEAQKLLGVSDSTVTRYLDELDKEGKIKRIGAEGRFVYYQKI